MSAATVKNGHCLCGAVRVTATAEDNVGACHCSSCRRWGGGPFMEINCGSDIEFDGQESISVFSSSDWAERGFCRQCGTHLFYRLKETREHMVPVGIFDGDHTYDFKSQVFIDEKPDFYSFANKTETLTGAELFAMFGAQDS